MCVLIALVAKKTQNEAFGCEICAFYGDFEKKLPIGFLRLRKVYMDWSKSPDYGKRNAYRK